ncbi:hypothetical protein [Streptosporangium sp. NPDC003464]
MHSIRISGLIVMLTSALAVTTVCALTPAAVAAAAAPSRTAVQPDPPQEPAEEPCPGGEPKPCGAPKEERDSVDSGRQDAKKDIAAAKEDIATAKEKVGQCPPGSKQCMESLIGDGAQQQKGIDDTRRTLDDFRPAPSDNAASVIDATCDAFGADLPAVFKSSEYFSQLTGVCELMNP